MKRLDDGQPLVEVARKMKAIEGMQPQINDMERRLGIMQSVEPVLENAIKTLQKVVDVRGMGKKSFVQVDDQVMVLTEKDDEPYLAKECYDGKGSYLRDQNKSDNREDFEKNHKCKDPCEHEKAKKEEAKEKAEEAEKREKQLEIIEHKKAADKIVKEQEKAEEKAFKAAIEGDDALKKEVEGKSSGKVGTKSAAAKAEGESPA